jgi:hypothetical protein
VFRQVSDARVWPFLVHSDQVQLMLLALLHVPFPDRDDEHAVSR